jgi:hypothetical protein
MTWPRSVRARLAFWHGLALLAVVVARQRIQDRVARQGLVVRPPVAGPRAHDQEAV